MQVQEKEKRISVIIDENEIGNIWELKVKLTNPKGVSAFGGRYLTEYIHPLTQKKTYLHNVDGQALLGFNIEKPTMRLYPNKDFNHRLLLDWLLAHPEVTVDGISLKEEVVNKKKKGGKIILKNLDKQEIQSFDEEEIIDVLLGRLSLEGGPQQISLAKLRYILAYFNLSYRDGRYIKDPKIEKKMLRRRIKEYARIIDNDPSSPDYKQSKARKITAILDKIDNYKIIYEIKEMIRLSIIREEYGMFKYNNIPVGTKIDSIVKFFNDSVEIYTEATESLYKALKQE